MQQSTIHYSSLPKTTLNQTQLQQIVFDAVKLHDSSFHFSNIANAVESTLRSTDGAFFIPSHTTYTGHLDEGDQARIREILWDYIILRYLTPGDYSHDEWPYLTITEKGKIFFGS